MKSSLKVVVLASCALAPALAAPPSTPAREDRGAQRNQTEMNACFGWDIERADDRLNAAYAKRIDGMRGDPDGIRLLRAAERAWLDFREKTAHSGRMAKRGAAFIRRWWRPAAFL